MNLLYKLERKLGRFCIQNLMLVIVVGQFAVFAANLIFPHLNLPALLSLNRAMIFEGQIWRLVTFLFLPPDSSVLLIVLALYVDYMIGGALENEWGSFRFNAYYFIGMLGSWIAMLLTGYGSNTYLNLSLFFAFAIYYPNYEFMLFFLLPIKVKWLAWANAALYLIVFITTPFWSTRVSILVSLLNVILFFGPQLIRTIRQQMSYHKTRQNFRRQMRQWNDR